MTYKALCIRLLILLLVSISGFVNPVTASERNYPYPRKNPVVLGSENYQPDKMSLQGLEGIFVELEIMESELLKAGSELPDSFVENIQKLITESGLQWLDKETVRWSPGQPILNIWPTLTTEGQGSGESSNKQSEDQNLAGVGNPDAPAVLAGALPSESDAGDDCAHCIAPPRCSTSIWMGFSQSASLLRQPLREYRLSTWGSGESTDSCENRAEWILETVESKIEKFVEDFKEVQKEQMPVIVSRAADLPRNCAQSWMMVDGVFDVNETLITSNAKTILERFVEFTADCNGFGYVVEAHDDNHADPQYNQILRTARSETVKELMNANGIHFRRIKLRSKNEQVPFMSGTLDAALLKGSIIIYPQSPVEFANLELEF